MPDSILAPVSRILTGDRAAIAWLYDTFAPRLLRRLALRFGAAGGLDSEDLLQDTFIYLLSHDGRALERFRARHTDGDPGEQDLEHFLWSAACGIASNRRRSLRRHPAASLGEREPAPTPIASAGGGENPALARDALERLGACLLRSGDRLHLYFQLRYLDGHKPAEIARITGWSKRATYKLKQSLDAALEGCVEELELSPS